MSTCDIHGPGRAICAVCAHNDADTAAEEIERLEAALDASERRLKEAREAWDFIRITLDPGIAPVAKRLDRALAEPPTGEKP